MHCAHQMGPAHCAFSRHEDKRKADDSNDGRASYNGFASQSKTNELAVISSSLLEETSSSPSFDLITQAPGESASPLFLKEELTFLETTRLSRSSAPRNIHPTKWKKEPLWRRGSSGYRLNRAYGRTDANSTNGALSAMAPAISASLSGELPSARRDL